jgi:carboxynorspermidine decarboxylase
MLVPVGAADEAVADRLRDAGEMGPAEVAGAVETPAFVVDERVVLGALDAADRLRDEVGCRVLYALKPLACPFVLDLMRGRLDGFAASSVFEARLARSAAGDAGSVHVTTPGFREAEIAELGRLCDHVAFNSLTQLARLAPALGGGPDKVGLRVNPQFPLVDDDRYNPCRPHSKLGVPLGQLRKHLRREPGILDDIGGLHFHSNCDSDDYRPLLRTVRHLEGRLREWLPLLRWINLGGGYLLGPSARTGPLAEAVDILRSRHGLEVFIEPGAALVREAGYLVSEVVDLFQSGGKTVAVLDTTVNHAPEVFEYQFEPDVLGHDDDGACEYLLVGSSCLAGDVLGEYGFDEPLRVGSRVVLANLGAYAMVKAHMFNGINLPTVYSVTGDGRLVLRRRFSYEDFLSRAGGPIDEAVRA